MSERQERFEEVMFLELKVDRGPEQGSADSLSELEKRKRTDDPCQGADSPFEFSVKTQPCQHLAVSPLKPILCF